MLAVLLWLGNTAHRAWLVARALLDDLDRVETLAAVRFDELDPAVVADLLHTTRRDVEAAEDIVGPYLWLAPHLGWVPGVGGDLQAAPHLLTIAGELSRAGDDVATLLLPILEQASDEPGHRADLVPQVLDTLSASRPGLVAARQAVDRAVRARQELESDKLTARSQSWVAKLDRYLPAFERSVDLALLGPELLGAHGPRTYLLLIQNEDELRATGGFVSAVAEVVVEQGSIVDMRFEDSYAVDDFSQPYPEPPRPLRTYMLADLWLFRDSNWSPDFPTAAQAALRLYEISRDARIDGIIAIDQHAVRLFVGALGPLYITGVDAAVTGDNVLQLARQAWSRGEQDADYDWWLGRKQFMADVLAAAQSRLSGNLDQVTITALGQAGWRALREKHALLYLLDREAAETAARAGFDGSVLAEAGDFLMVVDSNVGFNKVNGLVERETEYSVDLRQPDHPRARLVVRHRNRASAAPLCNHESRYDPTYDQMMQRCYWNYLRVLVRDDTELVSATPHRVDGSYLIGGEPSAGDVEVEPSVRGRAVHGTFLLVPTASEVETVFEFVLSPDVAVPAEDGLVRYTLTLQKQPGTQGENVRVIVTLPPRAVLVASSPAATALESDTVVYDLRLWTDRTIRLRYE
jgi:hypothetical protein